MVDAVAQQVHDRVTDLIEHSAVEFYVETLHTEGDFLAEIMGKIPDHTREPVEDVADRHHPRIHDFLLQVTGDTVQFLDRILEFPVLQLVRNPVQPRSQDHQLSNQIDHRVEMSYRDSHRLCLRELGNLGTAAVPCGNRRYRCLLCRVVDDASHRGLLHDRAIDLTHVGDRPNHLVVTGFRAEQDLERKLEALIFDVPRGRLGIDHRTHAAQPLEHHVRPDSLEHTCLFQRDGHCQQITTGTLTFSPGLYVSPSHRLG